MASESMLQLEIVTPQGVVLTERVEEVVAPSVKGEFGVLAGHLPMLAALHTGLLHYRKGGTVTDVAVGSGFAEVLNDKALILTDRYIVADDVDVLKVRERLKEVDAELDKWDGELDDPVVGMVGGFGEMVQVDPDRPWAGGRWIVRTESGRRYPLTLSTLLFDSSGTNKDAARQEHRDALRSVTAAAESPAADPFAVASALDWLLYDFLMAHREGPDSAAIVLAKGQEPDAELIVTAAAASVQRPRTRATASERRANRAPDTAGGSRSSPIPIAPKPTRPSATGTRTSEAK